ncbi:type I methionyl aminopeptidase [Acidithiobacillus sp. CV18-2]|uniref:Methionine aminopeptidase n=1 Tax=Igneacidithiobacillus copahuensis TaxID=2724909 RepID=A0AAE3CKY5_9PROT|nr:type I methionyl aminopeptidase [Igneacidithiobacillus copahuensis]MBU2755705.1 type I methionyl aminopeptidase [Acidithiobacillus sp. CV18-3]MBU2757048.1 type I methionyl aminopeptidase [Acidithiobacillus sp. BN09-2]MBU2778524.1 type I methionyl aminopeptidase [Acidithiobacillus sp. CV18-2]MBU2795393.1 type I methionyl aminopeptidase [Acidithiobacillus sp. VAN18-2]MBU2798138.1 type I methionyl aminopeptidase [Acidithiobacillus sp. VAN18-4]UTV82284.1 type I methionyl aminopeptidase [Acidit
MLRRAQARPPVVVHNAEEIEKMRVAGQLTAMVLKMIAEHVRPGISTGELDKICHDYIVNDLQGIPAPLHYQPSPEYPPFPKSVCISVNHVICHGIPGDRILKDGDILNIDVTVIKDGFHGDSSKMFLVGNVPLKARRVVEVAHESMVRGIEVVRPGATLGDIGHAIQSYAEAQHCSVVREFCGHGIGRKFHDEPQILHYGEPGKGLALQVGQTFTIEPMINAGKRHIKALPDGWTIVTKDHSPSAQWEHTVLVTETGHEVLTQLPGDSL